MNLDHLLQRADIWRGSEQSVRMPAIPTGFAELDAVFPGGGWPQGALTELLVPREGIGALQLLLPAVAGALRVDWLARVAHLKAEHPLRTPGIDDPRSPYGLIRAVADCLDDEATITTDVGQHQICLLYTSPSPRD